jgi:hypothetical protein
MDAALHRGPSPQGGGIADEDVVPTFGAGGTWLPDADVEQEDPSSVSLQYCSVSSGRRGRGAASVHRLCCVPEASSSARARTLTLALVVFLPSQLHMLGIGQRVYRVRGLLLNIDNTTTKTGAAVSKLLLRSPQFVGGDTCMVRVRGLGTRHGGHAASPLRTHERTPFAPHLLHAF